MAAVLEFPRDVWIDDALAEIYLVAGSTVPIWAGGLWARSDGLTMTMDGRPVYEIEDERGKIVGTMTIDGGFKVYD